MRRCRDREFHRLRRLSIRDAVSLGQPAESFPVLFCFTRPDLVVWIPPQWVGAGSFTEAVKPTLSGDLEATDLVAIVTFELFQSSPRTNIGERRNIVVLPDLAVAAEYLARQLREPRHPNGDYGCSSAELSPSVRP